MLPPQIVDGIVIPDYIDDNGLLVDMGADGEVTATVTPDGRFSIDSLALTNWSVEMKLTTAPAPFHAATRE